MMRETQKENIEGMTTTTVRIPMEKLI